MSKTFSLRGFQLLAVALICLLIGYVIGSYKVQLAWKEYKPLLGIESRNPPPGSKLDMALFYDVLNLVSKNYYDKTKLDSRKILYGAISGMVASFEDPYTAFFPPKQNTEFKTQLAGEFAGIGAELSLSSNNQIMVVSPLDDSPAKKAGLKPGDLILKVGDKDTIGWDIGKAVESIRGPRGTTVELTILHEKSKEAQKVKIIRDTIIIKSATGWLKNVTCDSTGKCQEKEGCIRCASVAYMRLSQFGDKTNNEWIQLVNKLYPQMEGDKNFKGVILDVRNNPGGYLTDAVFIASEFLKNGVVVIQEDGDKKQTPLSVNRTGLLTNIPVLVLINKGSASASEIVSGALRDHNRAKLVGEKSFGKGTIQQAEDVDGGASVHITVAKWLTPNQTWVHQKGLEPDIKVDFDASASAKTKDPIQGDNQLQKAIQTLIQ